MHASYQLKHEVLLSWLLKLWPILSCKLPPLLGELSSQALYNGMLAIKLQEVLERFPREHYKVTHREVKLLRNSCLDADSFFK